MCGGQCDEGRGECRLAIQGQQQQQQQRRPFSRELKSILLSAFKEELIYRNNIMIDEECALFT
jgi:hypothetical protein